MGAMSWLLNWFKGSERLVSPIGMEMVSVVGEYNPANLPKSHAGVRIMTVDPELREYPCGHEDSRTFRLSIYGEDTVVIENHDKCPECTQKFVLGTSIRCVKCGLGIFPGQSVALYGWSSRGIKRRFGTRVGASYIACLRADWCPSGAYYSGRWDERGFHPAFETIHSHVDEVVKSFNVD